LGVSWQVEHVLVRVTGLPNAASSLIPDTPAIGRWQTRDVRRLYSALAPQVALIRGAPSFREPVAYGYRQI
jgi:hypothetical protein